MVSVERWAEIRRMHRVERLSIREISKRTGLHRKTVRRALAGETPPRYERASMIVTSNKPFSAWGEIFGDDMAATAMIDRLIHHAEILSLKGDSYRLRGKELDARPPRAAV